MKQSYKEYRQEIKAEQEGLSQEEIINHLRAQKDTNGQPLYSHIFDTNNLQPQQHNWVDRGTVMSCEGAGHPHHQSFKRASA